MTMMVRLPAAWIILYGCALHAAGFFMPRGMKMFGWAFVLGGCGLFALGAPEGLRPIYLYAHSMMGLFFGALASGWRNPSITRSSDGPSINSIA